MFNLNKNDIARCGKNIGITIKWDGSEFQVYPKGTGPEHDESYFTTNGEDALRTALRMVQNKEVGSVREFMTTEELDIPTVDFWMVEDGYAEHPIGDRLYAVGDNVYRVEYSDGIIKYYFSLKEALEGSPE